MTGDCGLRSRKASDFDAESLMKINLQFQQESSPKRRQRMVGCQIVFGGIACFLCSLCTCCCFLNRGTQTRRRRRHIDTNYCCTPVELQDEDCLDLQDL